MHWNPRQARFTLLLFLLIFAAGQVKVYLARPVYPDLDQIQASWPPDGHIVDSTVLKNKSLEVFSQGTTINEAVSELGLEPDPSGSGFCLPRAGTLYRGAGGWSVRPMTQRQRWVWRIPMDLYRCQPEDLQRIKGIGPSMAMKIYRFVQNTGYLNSVSDLYKVPGIGVRKLEELGKELEIP